mmetsp:Transcript_72037/g.166876  ORF Transcript_72037/g.166876 Transcript_72037/m.166876 type:complete len:202 (-) Transcript_72037:87-692(-)
MFQCRFCTENVFAGLCGARSSASTRSANHRRQRGVLTRRSDEEAQRMAQQWDQFVHPRAREYFGSPGMLDDILIRIAKSVDARDDPIQGADTRCVLWHGDLKKGDSIYPADQSMENGDSTVTSSASGSDPNGPSRVRVQAAFRMVKPGEEEETVAYVNRVLAFTFASGDSFEQLMKLPKEPFKMRCGNQLCVHISHIALEV